MHFFGKTNIDFVGQRTKFFNFSLIINVFGVLAIAAGLAGFHYFEPEFGIDFEGGTELAVAFKGDVNAEKLRGVMEKALKSEPEIKSFGAGNQFLIRVKDVNNGGKVVNETLKANFPGSYTVLKEDKIGPKVGAEMRNYAMLSVVLAMVAILLYIAFRFEFVFGLGAIIALIHDVIFTITIVLLVNKLHIINLEVNQGMLAALLTVIGFSVHDTVIVFDRVRENKEKMKNVPLMELINISINETLSRTINTVLTVVMVLAIIVAFGGPVLQGFGFVMLIGIIIGSYSSIFVASSFVIWYTEKNKLAEKESKSLSKA